MTTHELELRAAAIYTAERGEDHFQAVYKGRKVVILSEDGEAVFRSYGLATLKYGIQAPQPKRPPQLMLL